MVDFRRMISPAAQKRMREDQAEMARLHALDGKSLARELMFLARKAVALRDDEIEIPYLTYTTALVLQTIPVLARRLDPDLTLVDLETKAIGAGRRDPVCNIESFEGDRLRAHVGSMISNAMMTYGLDEERADAREIRLLSRHLEHGNPVALMVDRLTPAPHVDRVIRPGTGDVVYPAWSPEEPRAPLEGLWLMGTTPNAGRERVMEYFDSQADAHEAMAAVGRDGLAQDHRLLRRFLGVEPKAGDTVVIRLRNNDDEAVGDALKVTIGESAYEAVVDEDGFSL